MSTPRRVRSRWLWVLLCLMPLLAQAKVQASLDRSSVPLGQTVTLNLRVEDPSGSQAPDLAPLAGDFTILGMSSNNSISIVNGRRSNQLSYGIALRPNRLGHLTIPALAVGGERTDPLQLEVTAAAAAGSAARAKVFVEASAEPGQVRVGEQLLLIVRLHYSGALSSASLSPPQVPGTEISRLGDDLNYDVQQNGRTYHVIEQRFAVVPRHAGKLDIAPFQFQGEMVDPTDPDSFFGMGTPVTAASEAVSVKVLPPPADWGASAWLPARELTLDLEGLPADGKVAVGQPLDLTMTMQARGLPYEALPELSLPEVKGAKVYPDKPVTATTASGSWMIGRRQRSFAVVPDRPGTLVLPATTVKWWNVQTGKAQFATIAEHRLTVLPAHGGGAAAASSAGSAPPAAGVPAEPAAAADDRAITPGMTALAAVVLVVLALLTGGWLGWRWWRSRRTAAASGGSHAAATSSPVLSARACRGSFMAVASTGPAAEQAARLLEWARAERPGLANLGQVASALASGPQRAAIAELQRRRYDERHEPGPLSLGRVFAGGFAWRTDAPPVHDGALPPLYPFKLR